jgi:hypothetical protein
VSLDDPKRTFHPINGTILAAKAPRDAFAFKAWLTDISRKVAEASSEGGGVQVSDAEKATLAEISKALGTTT